MTKKISDFQPQRRNANKHTPRGLGMLDNAIAKLGFIGAMTSAADGSMFDGSARLETSYGRFGDEVEPIIVRSRGDRPIIHIREDIPNADDPKAVELAVVANQVAAADLAWDNQILSEIHDEIGLDDWFDGETIAAWDEPTKEESNNGGQKWEVVIDCLTEAERSQLIEDLTQQGYTCRAGGKQAKQ